MWYKTDYNRLGVLLLPTFLRKPKIIALVQAMIRPVDTLYYKWYNWRIENIYKVEHTGQVCSLRGSLNDKFDPVFRRIYIGNGQEHEPLYIFTEAEQRYVWLFTEQEGKTIWLYTDTETADNGLDFIVHVPRAVFESRFFDLKAHIEFYKPGGKRYTILIIP